MVGISIIYGAILFITILIQKFGPRNMEKLNKLNERKKNDLQRLKSKVFVKLELIKTTSGTNIL